MDRYSVIDLVDASLRIVGTEIAAPSLSIVRAGAGAVEITGSEIEVEGAFSITGGTGPVRIVDSALSGTNNSEIDISGDIRIRHSTLSLDTQSSATFLVFATDDGAVDIAASSLSARADSFGLIELMAPQGLMLRSVELIAEAIELLPQDGGDLVFVNNVVAGGSPGAGGPAVISLPASSDPGAVVVVGNTFAAGATFRFDAGVQADRCVIEANDPEAAVIGAEDACP